MPIIAGEEPTLNPLRLLGRCFSWRGRFGRGQFAVAYLGNVIVSFGLGVLAVLAADRAGHRLIGGLIALILLVVGFVVSVGAVIRRLRDIARPGWWLAFLFIPCANAAFLLYLMFAPAKPGAIPDSSSAWHPSHPRAQWGARPRHSPQISSLGLRARPAESPTGGPERRCCGGRSGAPKRS